MCFSSICTTAIAGEVPKEDVKAYGVYDTSDPLCVTVKCDGLVPNIGYNAIVWNNTANPSKRVGMGAIAAESNTSGTFEIKVPIEEIADTSVLGNNGATTGYSVTLDPFISGLTDRLEVPVIIPVSNLKLDKTTATIAPGKQDTLQATVEPETASNKAITWNTSDSSIATVTNGVVSVSSSAAAGGKATITATVEDYASTWTVECEITVGNSIEPPKPVAVTGVTLNKSSISLKIGESATLTAAVKPSNADNKGVTWKSSDSSVATVSNGKITAVATGTATITVTTNDGGYTATCDVTVTDGGVVAVPVTGVALDKTAMSLQRGDTAKLTAAVSPADATNKAVTWTSSNPGIATVDADGNVSAVAVGVAEITVATADGGYTATCTVTVTESGTVPVNGVALSHTSISLKCGYSSKLIATVSPVDATNKAVTWTSSNPYIATVDAEGNVNAVRVGVATITVTTVDGGYTASCVVTVTGGSVWPGGGSFVDDPTGSKHNVILPLGVVGGSVTADGINVKFGETVTLTVTPDNGYRLESISVKDAKGGRIELKDLGNGKYSFTMPRAEVTVTVRFEEITSDVITGPVIPTQPVQTASVFTDVISGAYYYDAVQWAVAQGITTGTTASTFSPDATCTRAQMVTFLWRAAGSPTPTGYNNPFADVKSDAYYYNAVLWAVEKGITSGTSATTFSPDATVTRGQTVTFLYRGAGSPAAGNTSFADVDTGAYYAPAVAWAAGAGITSGTSASTFSPDAGCTRAQIVTFLYRAQ